MSRTLLLAILMPSLAFGGPLEDYAGGALPPAPSLPIEVQVQAMSGPRVLDALVMLVVTLGLLGVGYLIKSAWAANMRPWVFMSVILGGLMFSVVNPIYWQLKGARLSDTGVVVERYSASDLEMAWADVQGVRFDQGSVFPWFTDDSTLVLLGPDGATVPLPRFLPRHEELAALVASKLPPER